MPRRTLLIAIFSLCVGIAVGYLLRDALQRDRESRGTVVVRREGQYQHINPLLEFDIADDLLRNTELHPFKDRIQDYLATRMDKRWASSVSVYFRELNDGIWFSIGETEKFVPASLRKLPLMLALLKMSERSPANRDLLERRVRFELANDHNAKQNIKPSQELVRGREYSVRELIERMIVQSDNNAFMQLQTVVDPAELDQIYALLRIQNPRNTKDDQFLSVQTYASFFRILYNATYLNKEHSEWALGQLARAEFKAGLVAGVPPGVEVAHKFGEHSDDKLVQLHDCGIIYYPNNPYLLCVMSRGPSLEFLDDVIVNVSRQVFIEVDQQHRRQ